MGPVNPRVPLSNKSSADYDAHRAALSRGDCAGAVSVFQPYAQRGEAWAISNTGVAHQYCYRDVEAAVAFYTLAARLGDNFSRVKLTELGKPVPAPDLVPQRSGSSSSNAAALAAGLYMLQMSQPRPATNPLNCTTTYFGNTARTTCR
jgi:hypothetical protein